MTKQKFCIFVVDDDPILRMLIVDQLQNDSYIVHEFSSAAQAMSALQDLRPNLILLDIEMPEQNGLELCKKIRDAGINDVQVMFVSGHDNLETLLAAFDVGGNDFIPKNIKQDLLHSKVRDAIEIEKHQIGITQLPSSVHHSIPPNDFDSESNLCETGIVLHFLRLLFHCQDLQQLGHLLMETLNQFAVNGLVKLSDAHSEIEFSSNAVCTALEKTILGHVSKMGQIYRIEDRLGMNFPHITLLITKLNSEDEDAIGSLRDHLIIIAEATGVRIETMNIEQHRLAELNSQLERVKELANVLNEIKSHQNDNLLKIGNFIQQQKQNLENTFLPLELTETQEHVLKGIINPLMTQLNEFFENDTRLTARFNSLINTQKEW